MNLDLFTPAGPPKVEAVPWTQLYLSRLGRTYRYRVHQEQLELRHLEGTAPNSHAFELEFQDIEGRWREVRFYTRRDEIWAHLLETQAVGG